MTEKEYDREPRKAYDLSATAPVIVVDAKGKERFMISQGVYLDDSDCEWCWDPLKTCDSIGELTGCAGPKLRRLEALVVEIVDRPEFKVGPSYQFRECPFCGNWISNGMDHDRGTAIGNHGPLVCWIHRAEVALGRRSPQATDTKEK